MLAPSTLAKNINDQVCIEWGNIRLDVRIILFINHRIEKEREEIKKEIDEMLKAKKFNPIGHLDRH